MEYKYGELPDVQFENYKYRIHSMIHWLLRYEEEKAEFIDSYFLQVQVKLNGLNTLLNNPPELIEIMGLIEAAQLEYNSSNHEHKTFRKLILDAHELVDRLG